MFAVATHDVQLLALASSTTVDGAKHVAHVSWHGRQKFVPFGAKPGGHTTEHLPPFRVWFALAHVMQVSAPAPSHVAQLAWQPVQTPPPLRYFPAGQAVTHAPPSKFVRSHG